MSDYSLNNEKGGPRQAAGRDALGYQFLRRLAKLLLSVFYRQVEVVGLEHVPARGPLVLVANHHNALVDPLLLLATIPRPLVPIAKAPLFRHLLIAPFLRLIGAIPVRRAQDPECGPAGPRAEANPSRNGAALARAIAALQQGEAILIFPEGASQPEPTVLPLRTGAARIVLGAERAAGGSLGVTVLPVGLVYHRPAEFRTGRAVVTIGRPVATADLGARLDGAPEEAVRRLTDRMAQTLRRLIVDANDQETLRLLQLAERLWRQESGAPSPGAAARTAWMRQVLQAARYLGAHEPARLEGFRRELERYSRDLERAGLTGRELALSYPPGVVARYALREGLWLLLGLPLARLGIAIHLLPYQLTRLAVRLGRPDPDEVATWKISAGAVLYPLCWVLEGLAAWAVGGGWLLALFLAALVPAGLVALAWQARLARVRRDARGFLHFLVHRDLHERLLARRRALVAEMEALAALVPEPVLSGEEAP